MSRLPKAAKLFPVLCEWQHRMLFQSTARKLIIVRGFTQLLAWGFLPRLSQQFSSQPSISSGPCKSKSASKRHISKESDGDKPSRRTAAAEPFDAQWNVPRIDLKSACLAVVGLELSRIYPPAAHATSQSSCIASTLVRLWNLAAVDMRWTSWFL